MDWKNMKHGGFEEREEIEYYKHPKHYKHLVTHSISSSLVAFPDPRRKPSRGDCASQWGLPVDG